MSVARKSQPCSSAARNACCSGCDAIWCPSGACASIVANSSKSITSTNPRSAMCPHPSPLHPGSALRILSSSWCDPKAPKCWLRPHPSSLFEMYWAQGAALGSGVIIDSRGYIVTNNHVVSGAQSIQVRLSNGTTEPAQLTGTDAADDLAVLKIAVPPAGLSVATLGDSAQLQVGQAVLAIGNPLGDTETVTNGIVSALKRSVSEGQGGATIQNAIQTDA